jgi:fructokinase
MYILFDIGATKMRIARAGSLEAFDTPVIVDTPQSFEAGIDLFVATAKQLAGEEKIEAIAGGVSGSLSPDRRTLEVSPHLPLWSGKSIPAALEDRLVASVFIENDCTIVGLGEAHAGAGKGYHILAYITVSTGVGGTRLIGGMPDESARGFEPGQQIIDADNSLAPECRMPATLENCISGTAVAERSGKKPYEIPQNDPVWDQLADWLAVGLTNLIVMWSPDAIVLGGSMMVGNPAIPLARVHDKVKEKVAIFKQLPEIKKAELGAIGGIHGALVYLKERLKNK